MRHVLAVVLLAASAFAQSAYIKQVDKPNGDIAITNISGQPIVLIAGDLLFNGKLQGDNQPGNFYMEHFFKTTGFMAGDTHVFPDNPPGHSVRITFIQFEDGTTWGDKATATSALGHRAAAIAFLKSLMDSPNAPMQNGSREQTRYQTDCVNVGQAAALAHAKERYAAAMTRVNSSKF